LLALALSGNDFTGSIPASIIGSIITLQQLLLAKNKFEGVIPTALSTLINLGTLDLSDNPNLCGTFSTELYALINVERLYLNGCTNLPRNSVPVGWRYDLLDGNSPGWNSSWRSPSDLYLV
jgi:hypothetical protein